METLVLEPHWQAEEAGVTVLIEDGRSSDGHTCSGGIPAFPLDSSYLGLRRKVLFNSRMHRQTIPTVCFLGNPRSRQVDKTNHSLRKERPKTLGLNPSFKETGSFW